jgi:hypothetical protein
LKPSADKVPDPQHGISFYKLPDGTIVKLDGFVRREHWASFDIRRGSLPITSIDPFSVGSSQQIVGGVRPATSADTSIPRNGYSGLPQDWRGLVFSWRAAVVGPRRVVESDALASWLADCRAELHYNSKPMVSLPLATLVNAPSPPTPTPPLPLDIRENLSYGVRISPQHGLPAQALAMTLKAAEVDLTIRVFLDGLWSTARR